MKKISLIKILIAILSITLFIALIPISSACTFLELTFEDIVISSKIDKDTYKPLDEKIEFEASAEDIYMQQLTIQTSRDMITTGLSGQTLIQEK